jgi:hypothetical protein
MARKHSGGFIEEEHYWDIGDEERGHDGMDARVASKRYNDHRHPALVAEDANEALLWLSEAQQASYFTTPNGPRATQGGSIEDDALIVIRRVGDLMFYKGLPWMYAGSSLGAIPLGVGHGCRVDPANGIFTRGVDYRSIQLATSTIVEHTDEPIANVGRPLGERVCAYTLIPKNYSSSRTRPYMFIRATVSLNNVNNLLGGGILDAFPYRARVLVLTQDVAQGADGTYVGGLLRYAPMYDPANNEPRVNDEDLGTMEIRHTQTPAKVSVVDSNPFAINLDDPVVFIQVNVDTHVYTQDEVDQYNNANGTNFALQDVLRATECHANVFSITLESESYLGLPPFINDQNLRYTIPERPADA